MHEASLVTALLARVEQEARKRGARRVHRVEIALGELAGVECELLVTAWEAFRTNTCCDGAPLLVEREAAQWQCPRCGGPTGEDGYLRCPTCNLPARLVKGGDILLQRIEMEVSDV
jgi:hydrogenase nickel incorporation protein HypA/HybF